MPRMRIDKLGEKGLNLDVQPYLLPPQTWTNMVNCGTRDGELVSVTGEVKLFDLAIKPLYHTVFTTPTGVQELIISDGYRIFYYTMEGIGTEITPGEGGTGGAMTFTNLNGILVINSQREGAYYYNSADHTIQLLPGWDLTWRCTQIIAYKYYLVALGMIENDVTYNSKVRWSNSAAEGELPTEWVATTSNDAGDDLIGETPGAITGGCLVKEALFIVKEDSIYAMNYVGGTFVMQLSRLTGATVGSRVAKGFAEVKGGLVLYTSDDFLFFDGNKSVSLADQRIRTALQTSVSPELWLLSQVYVHNPTSTVYLAIVPSGSKQLRIAGVYDWEENTWGVRTLQYSYGFDSAYVDIGGTGVTRANVVVCNIKPLLVTLNGTISGVGASIGDGTSSTTLASVVAMQSETTGTLFQKMSAATISDPPGAYYITGVEFGCTSGTFSGMSIFVNMEK